MISFDSRDLLPCASIE